MYLGIAIFDEDSNEYDVELIVLVTGCCLLGRALSVSLLTYVLNFIRKDPISTEYQITMWFAGLRGPVAFALSRLAPNHTDLIISTTLIVVLITTVILGGLTGVVLEMLGVKRVPVQPEETPPDGLIPVQDADTENADPQKAPDLKMCDL
eukprot:UN05424